MDLIGSLHRAPCKTRSPHGSYALLPEVFQKLKGHSSVSFLSCPSRLLLEALTSLVDLNHKSLMLQGLSTPGQSVLTVGFMSASCSRKIMQQQIHCCKALLDEAIIKTLKKRKIGSKQHRHPKQSQCTTCSTKPYFVQTTLRKPWKTLRKKEKNPMNIYIKHIPTVRDAPSGCQSRRRSSQDRQSGVHRRGNGNSKWFLLSGL